MTHLLKSLELNGYKTFASSTEFEFAERVTAIVGPNGSGKSNIADALRWVLGEQSYSLLRGRKTEDMIFSGSEQRPRAGMASATVLFDNTNGWLPIDYSEVSISRRAYRDGQNEYLINGQRVRLRDVSELLAKSGLAERTYTIIGQGLVDAALALRADERRRLFEEAAGIGLYRSRREEALRRLDSTRRNLDRVKDIMAELRPRLRSLERQATRAREHEQIKQDLRQILLEWYGFHWHRSQKELVEAREIARRHQMALEEARRKQESLDHELAGYRTQIQALRTELNDWHRGSAEQHARREHLSRELAVGEERLRSMQRQRQELTASLEQVETEITFDQARLAEAEGTISGYALELQDAQEQQQLAGQALSSQQEKRRQIEADLQSLQQALAEQTARQSTLVDRRRELEARLDRQEERQAGLEQSVQQAIKSLEASEQRQQKLQAEHVAARDAREQAARSLEAAQAEARQQEETRRKVALSLAERQAETARLEARMDVLHQAERTLMGYADGVRLLLKAAREAHLPGLRGSLSDHLEVPAEWERAITAALGDYLEAVLLDTGIDADQALVHLQEGKSGAMLLPLDQLQAIPRLTLPEDPDCVGLAVDLVSTRPELSPALDLLLGRVLVVTDRQAARRMISGMPAGAKAVTRAGEVFHAEGPIRAHGQADPGGLSRQRQKREIEGNLAEIKTSIQALQANLEAADRELHALQETVEARTIALRQAQEAVDSTQAAAQQADLALETDRHQASWSQEQLQALLEEQGRSRAEIQDIQAEYERLEIEIGTNRQSLTEHQQALSELPLDDFRTQASHWELQVAVAGQVANQARERLQDQRASLERLEGRGEEIGARLARLSQNIEEQEVRQVSLRQEEAAVAEQIQTLAEKIAPAEAELQTAERSLESFRSEEIKARQGVGQAERYSTQSQIALARQQESLETLRYRIEDDFGLVEFSYDDSVSGPTPLPLEGMVEQLPVVTELSADIEESLKRKRAHLRRIGAINPEAQREHEEVRERFDFLTTQLNDLEAAEKHVVEVIEELDGLMEREFLATFEAVAKEFRDIFTRLFAGGTARLVLTDPDDMTGTGIDIDARLPGRRTQGLSLLSGGERSLTATALVFALLRVSPTPFCVLDEVDAMLDEANVGRFRELLQELSQETQFILITHNRGTVQVADVIYGVTMGRDSVSQVLSLKLDQVADVVPG